MSQPDTMRGKMDWTVRELMIEAQGVATSPMKLFYQMKKRFPHATTTDILAVMVKYTGAEPSKACPRRVLPTHSYITGLEIIRYNQGKRVFQ